jgi:hypothetical protein
MQLRMSALLSLTFGDPFSEIVGLADDWPRVASSEQLDDLIGRARSASSYWTAANYLYGARDVEDFIMFSGPVMQNCGLACELVLKCLLAGAGHSDSSLRTLGHSLSDLYNEVESQLDIYRFLVSVVEASRPIELPDEIADRFIELGQTREDADFGWRVFSQHIYLLDESYDRPFRARYVAAGPIALPEPFMLLLGSLILLNAMNERLKLPLIGTQYGIQSEPNSGATSLKPDHT